MIPVIRCNSLNMLYVKTEVGVASRHTLIKEIKTEKVCKYVTSIVISLFNPNESTKTTTHLEDNKKEYVNKT